MQSFPLIAFPVGIGAVIPNALAGSPIQYWGKAGVLTIYGDGDAAGLTWSLAIQDGQTNQQIVPTGSGLGVASTAGQVKTNENWMGMFAIPAGIQLVLGLANPTAAAINANFLFSIT